MEVHVASLPGLMEISFSHSIDHQKGTKTRSFCASPCAIPTTSCCNICMLEQLHAPNQIQGQNWHVWHGPDVSGATSHKDTGGNLIDFPIILEKYARRG